MLCMFWLAAVAAVCLICSHCCCILQGTKVQQTSKGSLVTFLDPSKKVAQLMANRKVGYSYDTDAQPCTVGPVSQWRQRGIFYHQE